MELITICFSHYNERARWALAHHGIAVHERPFMPGLHAPAVRKATQGRGRADKVSTKFSTPVLVRGPGDFLSDSGEIVRWVDSEYATPDRSLYPAEHAAKIVEFEAEIEGRFGADTRRIAYNVALGNPQMMRALATHNVSARQAKVFSVFGGGLGAMIRKGLGVDPVRSLRSLGRVEEMFEQMDERLAQREYFFGDGFTAADLTWACMSAPVLLPQVGYGAWLPHPDDIDHPLRPRLLALREGPAGRHALRMFADHRPASTPG